MTHIKAPTLFPREIIISQGVLTKFPHLEKNSRFNESPQI